MNLQYELRSGSYYLIDFDVAPNPITKEREIRLMSDVVSICFDRDNGTLHKHGRPESVEQWATVTAKKFRDNGLVEMANDLMVVTGAFPVDEINKCLSHSGYCKIFLEKILVMEPPKNIANI